MTFQGLGDSDDPRKPLTVLSDDPDESDSCRVPSLPALCVQTGHPGAQLLQHSQAERDPTTATDQNDRRVPLPAIPSRAAHRMADHGAQKYSICATCGFCAHAALQIPPFCCDLVVQCLREASSRAEEDHYPAAAFALLPTDVSVDNGVRVSLPPGDGRHIDEHILPGPPSQPARSGDGKSEGAAGKQLNKGEAGRSARQPHMRELGISRLSRAGCLERSRGELISGSRRQLRSRAVVISRRVVCEVRCGRLAARKAVGIEGLPLGRRSLIQLATIAHQGAGITVMIGQGRRVPGIGATLVHSVFRKAVSDRPIELPASWDPDVRRCLVPTRARVARPLPAAHDLSTFCFAPKSPATDRRPTEQPVDPQPHEQPGSSLGAPQRNGQSRPAPERLVMHDAADEEDHDQHTVRIVERLVVPLAERIEGESDHQREGDVCLRPRCQAKGRVGGRLERTTTPQLNR